MVDWRLIELRPGDAGGDPRAWLTRSLEEPRHDSGDPLPVLGLGSQLPSAGFRDGRERALRLFSEAPQLAEIQRRWRRRISEAYTVPSFNFRASSLICSMRRFIPTFAMSIGEHDRWNEDAVDAAITGPGSGLGDVSETGPGQAQWPERFRSRHSCTPRRTHAATCGLWAGVLRTSTLAPTSAFWARGAACPRGSTGTARSCQKIV
jgi:hypothetical protein